MSSERGGCTRHRHPRSRGEAFESRWRSRPVLHYPCVPGFSAFHRFAADGIDRCRAFESRAITLPLFPTMTLDQVDEICRQLALATGQSE